MVTPTMGIALSANIAPTVHACTLVCMPCMAFYSNYSKGQLQLRLEWLL